MWANKPMSKRKSSAPGGCSGTPDLRATRAPVPATSTPQMSPTPPFPCTKAARLHPPSCTTPQVYSRNSTSTLIAALSGQSPSTQAFSKNKPATCSEASRGLLALCQFTQAPCLPSAQTLRVSRNSPSVITTARVGAGQAPQLCQPSYQPRPR